MWQLSRVPCVSAACDCHIRLRISLHIGRGLELLHVTNAAQLGQFDLVPPQRHTVQSRYNELQQIFNAFLTKNFPWLFYWSVCERNIIILNYWLKVSKLFVHNFGFIWQTGKTVVRQLIMQLGKNHLRMLHNWPKSVNDLLNNISVKRKQTDGAKLLEYMFGSNTRLSNSQSIRILQPAEKKKLGLTFDKTKTPVAQHPMPTLKKTPWYATVC